MLSTGVFAAEDEDETDFGALERAARGQCATGTISTTAAAATAGQPLPCAAPPPPRPPPLPSGCDLRSLPRDVVVGVGGTGAARPPLPPQQQQRASAAPLPLPPRPSLPDPSNLRPLPRDLPSWGVPQPVAAAYLQKASVSLLHEWQAAALREASSGNSLVFAAPTSGGKSLVAEVLMVRQLLRARGAAESDAARAAAGGGNEGSLSPRKVRACVVLPYAALVAEKARHLASVLSPGGWTVKGYWSGSSAVEAASAGAGGSQGGGGNQSGVGGRGTPFNASSAAGSPGASRGEDVAVMTPEKLNGCLSALAARGRLGEVCCVVVDEAHTVSDPSRGPVLEVALAKLLFGHRRRSGPPGGSEKEASKVEPSRLQVVAMSATAAKLERLARWLGGGNDGKAPSPSAALFVTDVRPVPLSEFVVDASTGHVFRKLSVGCRGVGVEPAPFRALTAPAPRRAGDSLPAAATRGDGAALASLVAEAFAASEPTLVFCGSRAKAEGAARMLALSIPLLLPELFPIPPTATAASEPSSTPTSASPDSSSSAAVRASRLRAAAVERLRELTSGASNPLLERSLLSGVAWHHAGLSSAERTAVEEAFKGGAVLALAATSTLAAGVNLPAVRVVVRSLRQAGGAPGTGSPLLSRAQYLQMAGRAGRAGMAPRGECFLLIDPVERGDAAALLAAPLPPVESRLVVASAVAAASAAKEQQQRRGLLPAAPSGFAPASSVAAPAAPAPAAAKREPGGATGEEDPLERLLLEAVTCGSVSSSEDVVSLVDCTLARAEESEEEEDDEGEWGEETERRRRQREWRRRQRESGGVAAAAFGALTRLRERRLVSLKSEAATAKEEEEEERARAEQTSEQENEPPPPPSQRKPPLSLAVAPTLRGRAVAASCLPTSEGERMHDELESLFSNPLPLDTLVPLVFGVLPSSASISPSPSPSSGPGNNANNNSGGGSLSAFRVRNWSAWERALARRLSARSLRAAAALGVTREHAAGRARLGLSSTSSSSDPSATDERHHRFVAAAVAAALLEEESPEDVSAKYESVVVGAMSVDAAVAAAAEAASAARASSSSMAIPVGEFQRLLAEVSQRAALGAAVSAAAGWHHGAALLASISDRAAAGGAGAAAAGGCGGARPELLPLLAALPPPLLDARAARALYDAGITDVARVARAAEERIAKCFLSRVKRTTAAATERPNDDKKRPLPTDEPGAVWSRWAAKAAKAAKEAAKRKVKEEQDLRDEIERAAAAEGAALQLLQSQTTATTSATGWNGGGFQHFFLS